MQPELKQNELAIWERIIAAYLDVTSEYDIPSTNRVNTFYKLLEYSISSADDLIEINATGDQWEKYLLDKYLNAEKSGTINYKDLDQSF